MGQKIRVKLTRTITQEKYVTVEIPDSLLEDVEEDDRECEIDTIVDDRAGDLFSLADGEDDWEEVNQEEDDYSIEEYDTSMPADMLVDERGYIDLVEP